MIDQRAIDQTVFQPTNIAPHLSPSTVLDHLQFRSCETAILPLLIEPNVFVEYLHHPKILIIDLSQSQTFARAHVPGAFHLPYTRLIQGQPPAAGLLPELAQLETLLNDLGLSEDKHVVVYDDEGGGWAGRLIWTLDMLGHQHYSYLNGGIHAWLAEDLIVSKEITEPTPLETKRHFTLHPEFQVDAKWIIEHLNDREMVIWDARSHAEYLGTRVYAERGGHIPYARNYDWVLAMDRQRGLRLRELAVIEKELAELGITGDKIIVTHCQTHHRSGLTYMIAKLLGWNRVKAYPGSLSEWGNHQDFPVETGEAPSRSE